ncbi:hypothetical protein EVK82_19050 [Salmonella enterica]|nr:hypothetical protein [Salmonella enterica]
MAHVVFPGRGAPERFRQILFWLFSDLHVEKKKELRFTLYNVRLITYIIVNRRTAPIKTVHHRQETPPWKPKIRDWKSVYLSNRARRSMTSSLRWTPTSGQPAPMWYGHLFPRE